MKYIEKLAYSNYQKQFKTSTKDHKQIQHLTLKDLLLLEFDLFLFDGFGTLYLQDQAMPGALELWQSLKSLGRKTALLTNSASRSDQNITDSANRFGFDIKLTEVFSSGRFFELSNALDRNLKYFHIGNEFGLQKLIDNNFFIIDNTFADHIILSGPCNDKETENIKIQKAKKILELNPKAELHLLNPDACAPLSNGKKFLVSGAYAWLIDPKSQHKLHIYGKPSPNIFLWAAETLGVRPERTLMIGDTLGTDIAGAKAAGMKSALCLQGNSNIDNVYCDISSLGIQPDIFLSF